MKKLILLGVFFAACSSKQKIIPFEKIQRINDMMSYVLDEARKVLDTAIKKNNPEDSIFYSMYGDSANKIKYIKKVEYSDTIKIIEFVFDHDSLLSVNYDGSVAEKPEINWKGWYYIENNKVFYELNDKIKLDITNEIQDAYVMRDKFYGKVPQKK